MSRYTDRTALITGASSGLGAVFARRLAAAGADLVLVARRGDALHALAAELRAAHGRQVEVIVADLSVPGAGTEVAATVTGLGRTVDVLINNAGVGAHGDLHTAVARGELERLLAMVQLNCTTLLELTGRFLPGMVARGRGEIVNVSSTIAFQPVPHMAVYGASKAFVLSLSEALWAEVRGSGVRVLALCPGPTSTEFFDVVGRQDIGGPRQSAEQVVDLALRTLRGQRPTTVSGTANRLLAHTVRFFPRTLVPLIAGRTVPGSTDPSPGLARVDESTRFHQRTASLGLRSDVTEIPATLDHLDQYDAEERR